MDQSDFLQELIKVKTVLERFIHYKISNYYDAEDVLQEAYLTASLHYQDLHDVKNFKAWLIRIAANKCNDYYRFKSKEIDIPTDCAAETILCASSHGLSVKETVHDTLDMLPDKDKQILYLSYIKNMPQAEIAERLKIPVGTVKSRLFTAKTKFREKYPYPPKPTEEFKGENTMKTLPASLPEYKIVKLDTSAFRVKWEEIMGMFIIPKIGEKLQWGMYDMPSRALTGKYDMEVTNKAVIHGIEGVEIKSSYHDDNGSEPDHYYIAQLTDTHCRYLAEIYFDQFGIRRYLTFLDGEEFINEWGVGEDNCGKETVMRPKGIIQRKEDSITCKLTSEVIDVTGRYNITINGKDYDTVCVMNIEIHNNDAIACEQFIDFNGRTVLWRRFNRDDWAINRYKKLWSEQYPDNERININGETYVHWYDCITSYIIE